MHLHCLWVVYVVCLTLASSSAAEATTCERNAPEKWGLTIDSVERDGIAVEDLAAWNELTMVVRPVTDDRVSVYISEPGPNGKFYQGGFSLDE